MPIKISCFPAFCGLALASLVSPLLAGAQSAKDCSVSKPETAFAYLKQDRATLDRECIRRAIETLRHDDYKPAIDVLFTYLDFTPFPPGVAPSADASQPTSRIYPAADALFEFGDTVLPRVKQVIRDDNQTAVSRFNAARIYFALRPGPEPIRFIIQAARDSGDGEATTKLVQYATDAVGYCSEQERRACELALSQ